jgi:hypothetical protein
MRPEDIELSRRYADILSVRGNSERTIDNYVYAVKGFAQFLGERPLSSATANDIIAHQSAIKASGRSDELLSSVVDRPRMIRRPSPSAPCP